MLGGFDELVGESRVGVWLAIGRLGAIEGISRRSVASRAECL